MMSVSFQTFRTCQLYAIAHVFQKEREALNEVNEEADDFK